MKNMEDLPPDIQSRILSYVPPEYAVLSCKLVSKTWKSLLSHRKIPVSLFFSIELRGNPKLRSGYYDEVRKLSMADQDENDDEKSFYKKLTKIKHPISKEERHAELIGYSNGLVCLFMRQQYFCVLNPVTGEYFNLPAIENEDKQIISGFGYNPSKNNYKIVSVQYPNCGRKDKGHVQVYTLGGGDNRGWRDFGEIDNMLRYECIQWNGCLHWLDQCNGTIVAFDLADENFSYLPTNNLHVFGSHLKLLGGYLSMVGRCKGISIWSFKNNQRDSDLVFDKVGYKSWNWKLMFRIPTFPSPERDYDTDDDYDSDEYDFDTYEPFDITKNNEVLLWHKMHLHKSKTICPILLCRYDPETDTLNKVLRWETDGVSKFQGIPHLNSLVSLKSLGLDSKTTNQVAQIGMKRKREEE